MLSAVGASRYNLTMTSKVCPDCGSTENHRKNRSLCCTPCYDARYCTATCADCAGPMRLRSSRCAQCRWGHVQPKVMTEAQVAWLAGILEGEGSFLVRRNGSGVIQVAMTDRDIIDRLVEVTGAGRIHSRTPAKPHHRPAWVWHVRRHTHVVHIVTAVLPWLGERRTIAANKVLEALASRPPSRRTAA